MLDETDFRILSTLLINGRASFSVLGEAVGLSPHGAADRVRRLERDGIITGYTAIVDLPKVGRGLDAYVDVRLTSATVPEEFEDFCGTLTAVRELVFLTGRFDYLVRVACHDTEDLDQAVRAIRRHGGVAFTETRMVLRKSIVARRLD